mgnify:CR=1 FL=1
MVYKEYDDGFVVRRMMREDAKIVQKWYSGLCPTSCDLDIMLACYPDDQPGFYMGDYKGEVVASAMRIPVCDGVFYGSYYYVDDKHRGKGFGKRIRDDISMKHVGDNYLVVDAHAELEEMNQRRGFTSGFKVVLYRGRAPKGVPLDVPDGGRMAKV